MAVYAAQIDRMDQGIGKLVAKLKETRQFDNTLLMFLADNGGCAEENIRTEQKGVPPGPIESFTSYQTPWANASNTPFRLYKHWVHEGGISSPLILHWPAQIRGGGNWVTRPSHLVDIMATCVETGGAKYPADKIPMEGESLVAAAKGRKQRQRPLFWEHEGNRAVRDGDWKLVSRYPGDWELYNLREDRTEMRNLAGGEAARVASMKRVYEGWAARCNVLPWEEARG
jgi:arylsulfatase